MKGRIIVIMNRAIAAAALAAAATLSSIAPSHSAPVQVATSQNDTRSASGERRAANAWVTNDAALAILEAAEGLRLQSYRESGAWRIGYGHAGNISEGVTITSSQALAYLRDDLKVCEAGISEMVSVPVTQNEFSALVSLCFATGAMKLRNSTTVLRLNAGDRMGAADGILLWVKSGGKPDPKLVKVRTAERELFLN